MAKDLVTTFVRRRNAKNQNDSWKELSLLSEEHFNKVDSTHDDSSVSLNNKVKTSKKKLRTRRLLLSLNKSSFQKTQSLLKRAHKISTCSDNRLDSTNSFLIEELPSKEAENQNLDSSVLQTENNISNPTYFDSDLSIDDEIILPSQNEPQNNFSVTKLDLTPNNLFNSSLPSQTKSITQDKLENSLDTSDCNSFVSIKLKIKKRNIASEIDESCGDNSNKETLIKFTNESETNSMMMKSPKKLIKSSAKSFLDSSDNNRPLSENENKPDNSSSSKTGSNKLHNQTFSVILEQSEPDENNLICSDLQTKKSCKKGASPKKILSPKKKKLIDEQNKNVLDFTSSKSFKTDKSANILSTDPQNCFKPSRWMSPEYPVEDFTSGNTSTYDATNNCDSDTSGNLNVLMHGESPCIYLSHNMSPIKLDKALVAEEDPVKNIPLKEASNSHCGGEIANEDSYESQVSSNSCVNLNSLQQNKSPCKTSNNMKSLSDKKNEVIVGTPLKNAFESKDTVISHSLKNSEKSSSQMLSNSNNQALPLSPRKKRFIGDPGSSALPETASCQITTSEEPEKIQSTTSINQLANLSSPNKNISPSKIVLKNSIKKDRVVSYCLRSRGRNTNQNQADNSIEQTNQINLIINSATTESSQMIICDDPLKIPSSNLTDPLKNVSSPSKIKSPAKIIIKDSKKPDAVVSYCLRSRGKYVNQNQAIIDYSTQPSTKSSPLKNNFNNNKSKSNVATETMTESSPLKIDNSKSKVNDATEPTSKNSPVMKNDNSYKSTKEATSTGYSLAASDENTHQNQSPDTIEVARCCSNKMNKVKENLFKVCLDNVDPTDEVSPNSASSILLPVHQSSKLFPDQIDAQVIPGKSSSSKSPASASFCSVDSYHRGDNSQLLNSSPKSNSINSNVSLSDVKRSPLTIFEVNEKSPNKDSEALDDSRSPESFYEAANAQEMGNAIKEGNSDKNATLLNLSNSSNEASKTSCNLQITYKETNVSNGNFGDDQTDADVDINESLCTHELSHRVGNVESRETIECNVSASKENTDESMDGDSETVKSSSRSSSNEESLLPELQTVIEKSNSTKIPHYLTKYLNEHVKDVNSSCLTDTNGNMKSRKRKLNKGIDSDTCSPKQKTDFSPISDTDELIITVGDYDINVTNIVNDAYSKWRVPSKVLASINVINAELLWNKKRLFDNIAISDHSERKTKKELSEDDMRLMYKRWKQFCQLHGFNPKKPKYFFKTPLTSQYLSPELKKYFTSFISQDLRQCHSERTIFGHFRNLFLEENDTDLPSVYSDYENAVIIALHEGLGGQLSYVSALACYILGRSNHSITRQYLKLRRKGVHSPPKKQRKRKTLKDPLERVNDSNSSNDETNLKLIDIRLNCLKNKSEKLLRLFEIMLEIKGYSKNYTLQISDKDFSTSDWQMIADKTTNIPAHVAKALFQTKIHPLISSSQPVNKYKIIYKIIEHLKNKNYQDWEDVKWSQVSRTLKPLFYFTTFYEFVRHEVPVKHQKHFKDLMNYLLENKMEFIKQKMKSNIVLDIL